ncbi:MAG: HEAT repeat domain-containing protein [Alphaproteobacteria bacterium]|nr:HEAT repeat domain-containing protein [Alphaproteobacteria bacterium]
MSTLALLVALASPIHAAPSVEDAQAIWLIEAQRLPPIALTDFATREDPEVRARAALALGRLRHADALPLLRPLAEDADATVRANAAFALGLTPEGAAVAVERLAVEEDAAVRARLFDALGLQASADHLNLLRRGLDEAPEAARAAAVALGRHGMAKVEGVDAPAITDALAAQLRRFSPAPRRAAAFALARIGAVALSPATAAALSKQVRTDHDPVVRAFLVRALTPSTSVDGAAMVEAACKDLDRGVRVACARALPKVDHPDPLALLAPLLKDGDPGVRGAAITAVGGLEGVDHNAALDPLLADPDPRVVAQAISALAEAKAEVSLRNYMRPDQPEVVRVAAVSALDDVGQLTRLAIRGTEPVIRTAAAGRLLSLEPTLADALELLTASDDKVAAVGASLIADKPDPAALNALLSLARGSQDTDVLVESLRALAAVVPLVRERDRPTDALSVLVTRAELHPDAPVRAQAAALAALLGLTPPEPIHRPPVLPQLSEVERIVSARIFTDVGEVRVALRPDVAPYTVWNFARLAETDYFDGLRFHRVVPDFVVQDGCPRGDGWGGPGYAIPDELSWLPYDEGTLGMALSGPDTGGSQWFLTLSPQPHLDAGYTVFGQLTAGRAVLDQVQPGTVIRDIVIERI